MLPLAAIGVLAYNLLGDQSVFTSDANGYNKNESINDKSFQLSEMRTFGLRPKDNIGYGTNILELENAPQIFRTDSLGALRDVRGNSTRFLESARERNTYVGNLNWDKRNRKTITIPSYSSKIVKINVPTPAVVPNWYAMPNARVDRPSGKDYIDNIASNYLDPIGDLISPTNVYPLSGITSVEKFGNAWGPGGIYSRAMMEGGQRCERVGMFKDLDPMIPRIPKKSVKFARGTKL